MITGFNTNVRHGGRTFHVQTEDSGRNSPRVISHLYHGGTILASEKRDYADLLGSANLTTLVRRLMEEQHQSMLRRLKGGEFDEMIAMILDGASQPEPAAPGPEPASPAPASEATTAPEPVSGAEPEDAESLDEGGVSQKPLDEVILEYLVEKARGRTAEGGARPARGSRSRE
jgi:hypothetical protein